ncbi:hypothetical protein HPB51_003091 [Rhipicephalus microplus]|uniref:Uncharacterized protein n=1 Tax=Rhipicephalus microplus TaxID=6941 RepID=A0A9J6DFC7_RHIMP|nr:hypothetical protein HPB51_003091 [Rhipicephalus microplus]
MDRLKAKRAARHAQNTKLLQEARISMNDLNANIAKLTGILDHLDASNLELSSINATLEEHIPDDDLEAEYSSAAYNDQAIGMLTELRCEIADLGHVRSQPQAAVSAQTTTIAEANAQPMTVQPGLKAGPSCGLRLPKFSLLTFNGDIHNWTGFWEQF